MAEIEAGVVVVHKRALASPQHYVTYHFENDMTTAHRHSNATTAFEPQTRTNRTGSDCKGPRHIGRDGPTPCLLIQERWC